MQFKAPRGTTDILPEARPYWRLVESMAEKISENLLESILDSLIINLKKNKKIKISKFGTF